LSSLRSDESVVEERFLINVGSESSLQTEEIGLRVLSISFFGESS